MLHVGVIILIVCQRFVQNDFFFFFCILYIFIDWKLHTFFSQTNIVHINRQTRYIIYLHTHPTVPLNSILLLNIIQVQRSNNARFYIHLIAFKQNAKCKMTCS